MREMGTPALSRQFLRNTCFCGFELSLGDEPPKAERAAVCCTACTEWSMAMAPLVFYKTSNHSTTSSTTNIKDSSEKTIGISLGFQFLF